VPSAIRTPAVVALLLAAPGHAQTVAIVGADGDCNLTIQPFVPATFYVRAMPGGAIDGFTYAEFRVEGMPSGLPWFLTVTPSPIPDICTGNNCGLFADGVRLWSQACEDAPYDLFTISVFAYAPIPEIELSVHPHRFSSFPVGLPCAFFARCAPDYEYICFAGGRALVNSTRACDEPVAVRPGSWTRVKRMYE